VDPAAKDLNLRFSGSGVEPDSTDARRILRSALAYIEALAELAALQSPSKQSPKMTFEAVSKGSVVYSCKMHTDADPRKLLPDLSFMIASPAKAPMKLRGKIQAVSETTRQLGPILFNVATKDFSDSVTEAVNKAIRPLLRSRETLRVKVVRAGGNLPKVTLLSMMDSCEFSVDTDELTVRKIGAYVYQEVEADLSLERSQDPPFAIGGGKLIDFVPLSDGDPVTEWDEWYQNSDRPWQGMSVEEIDRELGDE